MGRRRRSAGARIFNTFLLFDLLLVLAAITYLILQRLNDPVRTGIFENIAADLITASFFTLLGASAFIWISLIQRYRLFRFFGVSRDALGVQVYLSQLQVQPGGTRGIEPINRGYIGPAIVKMEYDAGLLLTGLFRTRAVALIPDVLRELLSTLFVTLVDVDALIEIAPTQEEFSEERYLRENIVTCGSGIYNSISAHYLNQGGAFYAFTKNADGVRVLRAQGDGAPDLESVGRASNHELACIQRLKDPDNGITVFICAGLGSGATYGAVEYLVNNWSRLRSRFGDREFGLCLSFATMKPDEIPAVQPKVIHQVARKRPL